MSGSDREIDFDWMIHDGNGGYLGGCGEIYYPLDENFEIIKDAPVYNVYSEMSEGLRYVQILDTETYKVTPCYIDKSGKIIINLGSDIPTTAGLFCEGKALLQIENQLICIDKTGKELFTLEIKPSNSNFQFYGTFCYSEGYAVVSLNGDKYGYIDETGEFVIPAVLDSAKDVKNGYAPAALYENGFQYGILKVDQGV